MTPGTIPQGASILLAMLSGHRDSTDIAIVAGATHQATMHLLSLAEHIGWVEYDAVYAEYSLTESGRSAVVALDVIT